MWWQAPRTTRGVQLWQIEERQQAPDHPHRLGRPRNRLHLKFFIFQVV